MTYTTLRRALATGALVACLGGCGGGGGGSTNGGPDLSNDLGPVAGAIVQQFYFIPNPAKTSGTYELSVGFGLSLTNPGWNQTATLQKAVITLTDSTKPSLPAYVVTETNPVVSNVFGFLKSETAPQNAGTYDTYKVNLTGTTQNKTQQKPVDVTLEGKLTTSFQVNQ